MFKSKLSEVWTNLNLSETPLNHKNNTPPLKTMPLMEKKTNKKKNSFRSNWADSFDYINRFVCTTPIENKKIEWIFLSLDYHDNLYKIA